LIVNDNHARLSRRFDLLQWGRWSSRGKFKREGRHKGGRRAAKIGPDTGAEERELGKR